MDFSKYNIENIKLKASIKDSYEIIYDDSQIQIQTPILYIPFGIEEYYNSFNLNLQLRQCPEFEEFIENLEKHLIKELNTSQQYFTSQLRKSNKHDTLLYTKILTKNDKILCDIKKDNGEYVNIFSLGKGINCKALLSLDKVWFIKGKYTYKIKVKDIFI